MENIVKLCVKGKFPENYILLIFKWATVATLFYLYLLLYKIRISYSCKWVNGWVVKCLDVRSPSHLFHSCACRVSFVVILPELKFYFTFLYWANQSGCGTVLSIFYFSCSQRNQWKNNELKWNAAERDQKHWMYKIGIWRTDFDSEYFVVCVRASHHLKIWTDNK